MFDFKKRKKAKAPGDGESSDSELKLDIDTDKVDDFLKDTKAALAREPETERGGSSCGCW